MNMVRAGVVSHPSEWEFSGYREIQEPKQRYSLIDRERLHWVAGSVIEDDFQRSHASWVEEALRINSHQRETRWTESLAVGNKDFNEKVKKKLGHRARGCRTKASVSGSGMELREHVSDYKAGFDAENSVISENYSFFWGQKHEYSVC